MTDAPTSTATPRVQLGATTANNKWVVDVDKTPAAPEPTWIGVFGVTSFTPGTEQNLQDDSDFDSGGWGSQTNTANSWSLGLKVKRAVRPNTSPPVYDEGQEILRAAADQVGSGNSVRVRWYEMEQGGPRVEAYEGRAVVAWSEDGGDTKALSSATVTLTGQGRRNAVVHPDPANAQP